MLNTADPTERLTSFEKVSQHAWIVIPAYNEAATIRRLALEALALTSRVIIVDDGSTDDTSGCVADLPVTLLTHQQNQGKAASLLSAFSYAAANHAQCVITMDGDGQHNPADALKLLTTFRQHPNRIVIGARLHDRSQFPIARYYANRIACFWISWAAGHPIADSQSGFRVYPLQVINLALEGKVKGHRFTFESEILIEAAKRSLTTLAVSIAGVYPKDARPSHFRPVIDISKIVLMVAGQLLRQGMAPLGFFKCLKTAQVLDVADRPEPDNSFHAQHTSNT